ncbi:MAG: Holliday junction resolvase RuvX [Planctomycetota bacterium]
MTRYLCIDLGDKRTGLALGDDATKIASPWFTIDTRSPDERLRQLAKAIDDESPDELVVGLPLLGGGREGPNCKKCRAFAESLAARFGKRVHMADERLTSEVADGQMSLTGLTHEQKKARRDALAAAAILSIFFEQGPIDTYEVTSGP